LYSIFVSFALYRLSTLVSQHTPAIRQVTTRQISQEKVTLPMAGSFVPFSGVSNLKQGMGVGEGVSVGVEVDVGARVGEGVAGMPRARPQAARKAAVREVRVSLRKSRREMFLDMGTLRIWFSGKDLTCLIRAVVNRVARVDMGFD